MTGDEKQRTQQFWTDILRDIFDVKNTTTYIDFEKPVYVDGHKRYIDGYISETRVIIEQKSAYKDLDKPIRQSGGDELTAYQQAKRYDNFLGYNEKAKWIITSNFDEIWIYDMRKSRPEPFVISIDNFEKEFHQLSMLVKDVNEELQHEMEVSVKAGQLVGEIYDNLITQYKDPTNLETLRSLNQLCVRIVFLLFAEDANIFDRKNLFHDYMSSFPATQWRRALIELFKVLDTPLSDRDPYLEDNLKVFPYVNGGLFSDTSIEIPQFTDKLRALILLHASIEFDWSDISPTIFGAVFESTLNPETRRSGGMHYTSIENIHKVIDPLFMNDLEQEFAACATKKQLEAFQNKLASLTFFDPACGSGNFLTETYISLRRLENKVIAKLQGGQAVIGDFANPVKVDIHQFYGIEINDFAVSVATTALWIAELQMLRETRKIAQFSDNPLPLKTYRNIHEGNALRMDWTEIIAPEKLNYIIGNPPFVGNNNMNADQREDIKVFFPENKTMDYVCAWYVKAAELMQSNSSIRAALVSTNSICQGEMVPLLWKKLFASYGIHINFAHPTFRWDSESNLKAHVHCVIIGFSKSFGGPSSGSRPRLYRNDGTFQECQNINGYLMDAPDVFIDSRSKPLCDVPAIRKGNQPTEGGYLMFESKDELDKFLAVEPSSAKYIKKLTGAKEFINNIDRFCLWLKDASPVELRSMPYVMERLKKVREMRLNSSDKGTIRLADTPHLFRETNNPSSAILVPSHSSENRRYIPLGFIDDSVITTNATLIIPSATLYHFGLLTSSTHMDWMRAVCGRLEMRYRYSKDIVYNNFPWPSPTEEQKAKIEQTAQGILDARAIYPECSLADLYDERTMPIELRKAHQANDKAVMKAYGLSPDMAESDIIAHLFELYQKLVNN